ncbi:hypothetical protein KPL71_026405 [Citrus sinensis]|uniref:Uncharacterized protein n=1 Tax=Citrus sinensis TaxID=2711 RepID=A0ACB8HZ73_CITSI|nr:hypothetical protein KPL71_026405 [Citrus sinensis]
MGNVRVLSQGSFLVVGHRADFGQKVFSDQGPGHKGPGTIQARPNRATTWDGNGSAHMHHLIKALQSSRLLEVACQPRFPSLKTILLTKCPSLGWGYTAMSSSLQDSTPSRAGCRPRWSWEPTYTFLGLALPQHLNKRRAPKRNPLQESFAWQRLGKHGRATCRETCTCGSGRGPRYTVLICVETNRAPFDLPEAEAESVAGYNVEYARDAILNSPLLAEANVPGSRGLILTETRGGSLPT